MVPLLLPPVSLQQVCFRATQGPLSRPVTHDIGALCDAVGSVLRPLDTLPKEIRRRCGQADELEVSEARARARARVKASLEEDNNTIQYNTIQYNTIQYNTIRATLNLTKIINPLDSDSDSCSHSFGSLHSPPPLLSTWLDVSLTCGIVTSLDVALSNLSMVYITVTFYTMVKSSSPVFTLFFAALLKIEKITWRLVSFRLRSPCDRRAIRGFNPLLN